MHVTTQVEIWPRTQFPQAMFGREKNMSQSVVTVNR